MVVYISVLPVMSEYIPQENSPSSQNNINPNAAQTAASNKSPSSVSGSPDKQTNPVPPKSSNNKIYVITQEQMAQLLQQIKKWAKYKMRSQIRQEVLRELQPELKRQFREKVKQMIDMFIGMFNGTCKASPEFELFFKSNQPIFLQQNVEKMLPSIMELPEEQQQDVEPDSRRSRSPHRQRTPDARRRKHRKRKNESDSSDSQSSDSSDLEQYMLVKETLSKGISDALDLYHKYITEDYTLVPKTKKT